MSLPPTQNFAIPELTMQVARAAFPKGSDYMRLRDELGTIFTDEAFAALYLREVNRGKRHGGWRWRH
jgi:transposase